MSKSARRFRIADRPTPPPPDTAHDPDEATAQKQTRLLVELDHHPTMPGQVSAHVLVQQMSHDVLRTIMLGLWASMDEACRVDFMCELLYYVQGMTEPEKYPGRTLSGLADAIATGLNTPENVHYDD